MATISLRNTTMTIGGVVAKLSDGNLTYSQKTPMEYLTDGIEIVDVREGPEQPMSLSITCIWESVKDDAKNLIQAIKGESITSDSLYDATTNPSTFDTVAGVISSDTITCRPYACDVVITSSKTCTNGAPSASTVTTFPDFRYESLDYDLKTGKLSVSGMCNVSRPIIS